MDSTTRTPTVPTPDVAEAHGACLPEHCATRRSVLIGAGVLGAAALAGCGSKSSGAAVAPGATTGAAAAGATALAKLSDIPVGEAIAATDAGAPIILAQPSAGVVKGFSAICTHMGCTVAPAASGKELDCPCHGSKYNALTGAVIHGPAPKSLPPVAVKVVNGSVVPA